MIDITYASKENQSPSMDSVHDLLMFYIDLERAKIDWYLNYPQYQTDVEEIYKRIEILEHLLREYPKGTMASGDNNVSENQRPLRY